MIKRFLLLPVKGRTDLEINYNTHQMVKVEYRTKNGADNQVILVRGVLPTGEIYAVSTSFRVE